MISSPKVYIYTLEQSLFVRAIAMQGCMALDLWLCIDRQCGPNGCRFNILWCDTEVKVDKHLHKGNGH